MAENVVNLDKSEHLTNKEILSSASHLKEFIIIGFNEEGDLEVANSGMDTASQLFVMELHKQMLLNSTIYPEEE